MRRCRFVGEKDSADHAKGEGSLTYTNGDRFEVKKTPLESIHVICLTDSRVEV